MLWALDHLGAGVGEQGVHASYLEQPDHPGSIGLVNGKTGVLLVSWKLDPTAFLALCARTGDEIWRERARAFAVHAFEQVEASESRYSLWTGHIGVALYLQACLTGWQGMPVLDVL